MFKKLGLEPSRLEGSEFSAKSEEELEQEKNEILRRLEELMKKKNENEQVMADLRVLLESIDDGDDRTAIEQTIAEAESELTRIDKEIEDLEAKKLEIEEIIKRKQESKLSAVADLTRLKVEQERKEGQKLKLEQYLDSLNRIAFGGTVLIIGVLGEEGMTKLVDEATGDLEWSPKVAGLDDEVGKAMTKDWQELKRKKAEKEEKPVLEFVFASGGDNIDMERKKIEAAKKVLDREGVAEVAKKVAERQLGKAKEALDAIKKEEISLWFRQEVVNFLISHPELLSAEIRRKIESGDLTPDETIEKIEGCFNPDNLDIQMMIHLPAEIGEKVAKSISDDDLASGKYDKTPVALTKEYRQRREFFLSGLKSSTFTGVGLEEVRLELDRLFKILEMYDGNERCFVNVGYRNHRVGERVKKAKSADDLVGLIYDLRKGYGQNIDLAQKFGEVLNFNAKVLDNFRKYELGRQSLRCEAEKQNEELEGLKNRVDAKCKEIEPMIAEIKGLVEKCKKDYSGSIGELVQKMQAFSAQVELDFGYRMTASGQRTIGSLGTKLETEFGFDFFSFGEAKEVKDAFNNLLDFLRNKRNHYAGQLVILSFFDKELEDVSKEIDRVTDDHSGKYLSEEMVAIGGRRSGMYRSISSRLATTKNSSFDSMNEWIEKVKEFDKQENERIFVEALEDYRKKMEEAWVLVEQKMADYKKYFDKEYSPKRKELDNRRSILLGELKKTQEEPGIKWFFSGGNEGRNRKIEEIKREIEDIEKKIDKLDKEQKDKESGVSEKKEYLFRHVAINIEPIFVETDYSSGRKDGFSVLDYNNALATRKKKAEKEFLKEKERS